jgi:hypothetical protein
MARRESRQKKKKVEGEKRKWCETRDGKGEKKSRGLVRI